jgi:hypothetical protein
MDFVIFIPSASKHALLISKELSLSSLGLSPPGWSAGRFHGVHLQESGAWLGFPLGLCFVAVSLLCLHAGVYVGGMRSGAAGLFRCGLLFLSPTHRSLLLLVDASAPMSGTMAQRLHQSPAGCPSPSMLRGRPPFSGVPSLWLELHRALSSPLALNGRGIGSHAPSRIGPSRTVEPVGKSLWQLHLPPLQQTIVKSFSACLCLLHPCHWLLCLI